MELRVKELIKNKGLLMQDIANRIGISRDTLTRNINGNPTIDTLEKIAKALDVDIVELFPATSTEQLIALISHRNEFYKATTLKELEEIVEKIKANKDDNK